MGYVNILLGMGITKSQHLIQVGPSELVAVGIPHAAARYMQRQAHLKHPVTAGGTRNPRGQSIEV